MPREISFEAKPIKLHSTFLPVRAAAGYAKRIRRRQVPVEHEQRQRHRGGLERVDLKGMSNAVLNPPGP